MVIKRVSSLFIVMFSSKKKNIPKKTLKTVAALEAKQCERKQREKSDAHSNGLV